MSTFNRVKFTAIGLLFVTTFVSKVVFAEQLLANKETSVASDDSAIEEMIPPAPPGPYVSTGLQDVKTETSSVTKPLVDNSSPESQPLIDMVKPDIANNVADKSPDVPMDTFSPDIPWPSNMRPSAPYPSGPWVSNQKMNKFVNKQVRQGQNMQKPYLAPGYKSPTADYSRNLNTSSQYMSNRWPQQRPVVDASPGGANVYIPGYGYKMPGQLAPQNNSSYGYPAGRMPYPSNFQQANPD